MQTLQNPLLHHHFLFSLPQTPNPTKPNRHRRSLRWRPLVSSGGGAWRELRRRCLPSDEFPVDETFMESFVPRDKETEDEARIKNWTERGWAPWDEVLTPEADFARKSLNEGEEVPLQTPEAIEAFHMLKPSYRKKKMEEMGLTEDDYYRKQFEIKGEIPEPLETTWSGPLVLRHLPPRDWPPRGWEVDRKELEFIREAHKLQPERLSLEELEKNVTMVTGSEDMCLDRYRMFLKQYNEWVAANKDRLEEESYREDQDYCPGRRKRGEDYEEGMYELPFYYPGQICSGVVTTLHLYQGAFVNVGGVYDGWVPIRGNDWFWIRHHIKVGMDVVVEILAKRDPYRYRFPLEMRFLDPNIDHLIFNRFEFPPIFHRDNDDEYPDELRRECGRPPVPQKIPGDNPVEEPLLSNHPYVDQLWQIHVAEQMILDDLEANPEKYEGKKLSELSDDEEITEENSIVHTEAYYKNTKVPKVILKTSVKDLDLEAAFAERQLRNKARKEAEERGETYKVKMRRNNEMDEYDKLHWQRSYEERQAFIRDISCRQALGLPLEEPGKFFEASYFGKGQYDPDNPRYRYDYWGEPENSEKSRQQRMTDAHNKAIVGKSNVWYEESYEECIRKKEEREAQGIKPRVPEDEEAEMYEDDDDDDEYDYSIFSEPNVDLSDQPHVNGTESSKISDEDMFED